MVNSDETFTLFSILISMAFFLRDLFFFNPANLSKLLVAIRRSRPPGEEEAKMKEWWETLDESVKQRKEDPYTIASRTTFGRLDHKYNLLL